VGHELAVEHGDLAVEQERRGLERGHRGGLHSIPRVGLTPAEIEALGL